MPGREGGRGPSGKNGSPGATGSTGAPGPTVEAKQLRSVGVHGGGSKTAYTPGQYTDLIQQAVDEARGAGCGCALSTTVKVQSACPCVRVRVAALRAKGDAIKQALSGVVGRLEKPRG